MDNVIKNLFYFFIMLLTAFPIIELFRKGRHWLIKILIIITLIVFLIVAKWDKNIEDREKIASGNKIDSLSADITFLKNGRAFDEDFKKKLLREFNIKDSANMPVQIKNYNTYIKKAERVDIGDH